MDFQNLPWWGQFLVGLFIGLIIFLVFYFAVYDKNSKRIDGLTVEIEKVDKEIRRAEQKEDLMPQLEADIEEKEAILETLKEILPEKKEIAAILKKIESLIGSARLKLNGITTNAVVTAKFYIQHPYSLKLEGNFHNLGIFYDQLSKLRKIFTINSLSISPRSKMTRENTITASFTASTYTYRETVPAKTTATKRRSRRKK